MRPSRRRRYGGGANPKDLTRPIFSLTKAISTFPQSVLLFALHDGMASLDDNDRIMGYRK
jgi:hypothetical protein